jgi:hypothetical protein
MEFARIGVVLPGRGSSPDLAEIGELALESAAGLAGAWPAAAFALVEVRCSLPGESDSGAGLRSHPTPIPMTSEMNPVMMLLLMKTS